MDQGGQGASASCGTPCCTRLDDRGYILVALLVGMAVASVWMAALLPVWRQQMVREKEADLIFRGQQYARAIFFFQQKNSNNGPQNIDDLVAQHYLRRKWKDPITGDDFQLVPCGQVAAPGQAAPGRGTTGPSTPPQSAPSQAAPGRAAPAGSGSPSVQIGQGGICGVRSKSNKASVKVYQNQQEYDLWRFDNQTAQQLVSQSIQKLGGTPLPQQGQPGRGAPGQQPGVQPGRQPGIQAPGGRAQPGQPGQPGQGPAQPGQGQGPGRIQPGGGFPTGTTPIGRGRGEN